MALGAAALLAFETALIVMLGPDSQAVRGYLLGLLHMGIVGAFVFLANSAFVAHDREAILHVRGAWGEENTRSELQRARRRRLIWGWVDSLTVQGGDIDHLVVTRTGGLVAIDSKWRSNTDLSDRAEMARAAQKARLRAEGITNTVLDRRRHVRREAGRYRITPLLVVWGAAQHSVPEGAVVDGVDVVGGRRLVGWFRHLEGQAMDQETARELLARLEDFRSTAWKSGRRSRGHS
jgi:hypothetical protein